jgi:hypothetical protein
MNRTKTIVAALALLTVLLARPNNGCADAPNPPVNPPDAQAIIGDVTLNNKNLNDALELLRATFKVNIVVNWGAVNDVGVDKTTPITIQLAHVSAPTALRAVLMAAAGHNVLGYTVRENVVTISTRSDLQLPETFERTPPAPALEAALQGDVPKVTVNDLPLEKAIEFVRSAGKINIVVDWNALSPIGVEPQTPITLHLEHVTVSALLKAVLRAAVGREGVVDMALCDNVVTISTISVLNPEPSAEGAAAPPVGADATEIGKQLWTLDVDIAGLKARIAACQRIAEDKKASDAIREKVELTRTTAEIELAGLLARHEVLERAYAALQAEDAEHSPKK